MKKKYVKKIKKQVSAIMLALFMSVSCLYGGSNGGYVHAETVNEEGSSEDDTAAPTEAPTTEAPTTEAPTTTQSSTECAHKNVKREMQDTHKISEKCADCGTTLKQNLEPTNDERKAYCGDKHINVVTDKNGEKKCDFCKTVIEPAPTAVETDKASEEVEEKTTEKPVKEETKTPDKKFIGNGSDVEGYIEQIQVMIPRVRAYFYISDDYDLANTSSFEIKGHVDGADIPKKDIHKWGDSDSDKGIHYYIVINKSDSISKGDVDTIKSQIADFEKLVNDGDIVEEPVEVKDVFDEIKSISNKIEDENKDSEEFSGYRNVVIIIAGDDCDGTNLEDAKTEVSKNGISAYIFTKDVEAMKGTKLADFVAFTGGECKEFSEYKYLGTDIKDFKNEVLSKAYVADFSFANDGSDGKKHTINIIIKSDKKNEILTYKTEREFLISEEHIVSDSEKPFIYEGSVKLSKEDGKSITVEFSELVDNADNKSNYKLVSADGNEVAIKSVEYDAFYDSYVISLADVLYEGEYTLTVSGICDCSADANEMDEASFTITSDIVYEEMSNGDDGNSNNASDDGTSEDGSSSEKSPINLIIIIAAAVIVLLIIVVIILATKNKKSSGNKKSEATKKTNSTSNSSSNKSSKRDSSTKSIKSASADASSAAKISVEQKNKNGKKISLFFNQKGKVVYTAEVFVDGSIMVGRSDLCDVFVEDDRMSRQHFAIEYDGTDFFVQDLDTTNGTRLNGAPIKHKRRVEKNDRITAGSFDIIVRW